MSEAAASTPTPAPSTVETAVEGQPIVVKDPSPPKPEYHEIKVNGAIKRYTTEELKNKATLGEAAHQKFEQAAQLSKEHGALKEKLRNNFIDALMDKDLGLSKDQIRGQFEKWYHENYIEPEMLNEDQRRARELEKRVKQFEAEKEQQLKEHQTREQQALESHATQEVQAQIIQAIEKSGLPKTQESARKVAYWMRHNLQYGFDAPMDVIIQQVKDSDRNTIQQQIANAPIEYIIELFGKDIITKLRKYDLEKLKSKFEPKAEQNKPKSHKAEAPKRMSDVDSYFKKLRQQKS